MVDKKIKNKVPVSFGNDGENFQLWALRVRTRLRGKELISAITERSTERRINENKLSLKVPALGDNPLRAVQECELAKYLWEKLQEWYSGKIVIKN